MTQFFDIIFEDLRSSKRSVNRLLSIGILFALLGHFFVVEPYFQYIIRASFSQERMNYYRETGQSEYRSKDGKETKVIDALEWLAAMCSHVPNKGEQMARYYG